MFTRVHSHSFFTLFRVQKSHFFSHFSLFRVDNSCFWVVFTLFRVNWHSLVFSLFLHLESMPHVILVHIFVKFTCYSIQTWDFVGLITTCNLTNPCRPTMVFNRPIPGDFKLLSLQPSITGWPNFKNPQGNTQGWQVPVGLEACSKSYYLFDHYGYFYRLKVIDSWNSGFNINYYKVYALVWQTTSMHWHLQIWLDLKTRGGMFFHCLDPTKPNY